MSFKNIDAYLNDTIELPYGGKTYVIQPVDAETGLWVERIMSLAADAHRAQQGGPDVVLSPDDAADLEPPGGGRRTVFEVILGDTLQELRDDKVPHTVMKLINATVLIWISAGVEQAEEYWAAGGRPGKAPKAPADRKPSAKRAPRASTAGTTARRPAAKKVAAGRGSRSSSTGR
jgi:hypothetical protein